MWWRTFLEFEIQYLEKLNEFHNDLPFLPERMKIEKIEKLPADLRDASEYVIHIRNLKRAWIKSWISFEKTFLEWLDWINMFCWNHILKWIQI